MPESFCVMWRSLLDGGRGVQCSCQWREGDVIYRRAGGFGPRRARKRCGVESNWNICGVAGIARIAAFGSSYTDPCRSCRRLRSFDFFNHPANGKKTAISPPQSLPAHPPEPGARHSQWREIAIPQSFDAASGRARWESTDRPPPQRICTGQRIVGYSPSTSRV